MIPLLKPYISKSLPDLLNLINSGNLMSKELLKTLEENLNSFLKTSNIKVISNYETAIEISLKALDINVNDEVVTSPLSCLASTQPLLNYGLRINWCDVDKFLGVPGINEIEQAITDNTKVVIYNCFAGYAKDLDLIYDLCKKRNIYLVIDCIEAFGSKFNFNYIGVKYCDLAIYNFHTVRTFNALEAGAILSQNKQVNEKIRLMRDYGINRVLFREKNGEIDSNFDIKTIGKGAMLGTVNSYIGIRNLQEISTVLEKSRNNSKKWRERFETELYSFMDTIKIPNNLEHNSWVFGLFTNDFERSKLFFTKLGFQSSKLHYPNNLYSIFPSKKLEGVNYFYNHFLAIPSGHFFEL
jgi:perosamine synthetase